MLDPRMKKLADLLVGYSTKVQPGERVLIDAYDIPVDMVEVLVERVVEAGGIPFVDTMQARVRRVLFQNATEEQLSILRERDLAFMREMNCYIAVRGSGNINEMSDVPDDKMKLAQQHWLKPLTDQRVNHTKWVVLRWPTSSMAQLAGMSTHQFEDFFFGQVVD